MKAIISTGNKQYLVQEGDVVTIDIIDTSKKEVSFTPLMLVSDKETLIGTPELAGHSVKAEITEELVRDDKVLAIRYKAKKRVHKVRGHRQGHTQIKITSVK